MNLFKTPIDIKTLIQTSTIEIYDKTKLVEKLQEHFSDDEQRLYVCNLFLFLNYHPINDFIINLENVWKFIGFSNKANAKRLLKHNFTEENDYKIIFIRTDENKTLLIRMDEQKKDNRGGHNEETIMLNINTFKKLCLKANTDKADKIHDYYIRLEMIYNELMKEELQKKEKLLIEQREQTEQEKEQLLETTLLNQYHKNVQCIYYGKIDNKDTVGGSLVKFGMSNNLQERVKNHKKTYTNFRLTNVFKVSNQIEIENCIKNHPILKKPLFTEKYLTTTLSNGVRLNGIVDRIDETASGFHVIDYKSNKYAEKLEPFVDEQNIGNGYWKQGAIYSRLILNNFPDIKNTQLSFDYLTLNKRVEFIGGSNAEFENWLSTIWEEIQSLSIKETCSDQACVYCEKNDQ